MMADGNALTMHNVVKRYGAVRALDEFSLAIPRGQIYGLLGPNGAGKTTALRIICGLLIPDSGDGHCLNAALGTTPRNLGYVPQRGGLYDDLSVTENLRFHARAQGLQRPREVVAGMLHEHGLDQRASQRVGVLSGGWRQRVALATALMHGPQLVLLDEPTSGLDVAERCDRIGYLSGGRLLAEAAPSQLAQQLGIAVWLIDRSHGAPPPVRAGMRLLQDSAGWRVVTHIDASLTEPLMAWHARVGLTPQRIAPCLTDALAWLTRDPGVDA